MPSPTIRSHPRLLLKYKLMPGAALHGHTLSYNKHEEIEPAVVLQQSSACVSRKIYVNCLKDHVFPIKMSRKLLTCPGVGITDFLDSSQIGR